MGLDGIPEQCAVALAGAQCLPVRNVYAVGSGRLSVDRVGAGGWGSAGQVGGQIDLSMAVASWVRTGA